MSYSIQELINNDEISNVTANEDNKLFQEYTERQMAIPFQNIMLNYDAMVERNKCVLSGVEDLELILEIKNFPICMCAVDKGSEDEQDFSSDMKWWISKNTGIIQLNPLVPLDFLYKKGHGSGSVGKIWEQHHVEFADFIYECGVKQVLEIGAGNGKLAQYFVNFHIDSQYYIVEPNLPSWTHDRVTMYKRMFDESFVMDSKVDAVVHSHLFEHIYEPREFLLNIAKFLPEGQWHIFSLPRLEKWIQKGYLNALNFEHTIYLTETNVEYLMMSCGFEIVHKKYFREDHSIFYATRKSATASKYAILPHNYLENHLMFMSWVKSAQEFVESVNVKIAQYSIGKIYVYGGHIFTQFLIKFGLNVSSIYGILDNDPFKVGNRLYGTNLRIFLPELELNGQKGAVIIMRMGAYQDEIKKSIRDKLSDDITFWE
jgi:hypothetical protein